MNFSLLIISLYVSSPNIMLNTDLTKRVVIKTKEMKWADSPSAGVSRKRLAREEEERGHATSIVRYERGANFNRHHHPFGEEIFVLDGIFSDERGDYPTGSYVRNPPGSVHAPFSVNGCILFVKLHQFLETDTEQFVIDTNNTRWYQSIGGIKVMLLHSFEEERVALFKCSAKKFFLLPKHIGGEEILVISGVFKDEFGEYPTGSWVRNPDSNGHKIYTEIETVILFKTGHLLPA